MHDYNINRIKNHNQGAIDALYFYVAANLWVRYGALGEKDPNLFKNTQYCTVKACITQKINPASQLGGLLSTNENNVLQNRQTC